MELKKIVAAHPLGEAPYQFIQFSRVDGCGTPLYRVDKATKELGGPEALRTAFEKHGGRCFHCKKKLKAQQLSERCNRDHVVPRKAGGRGYLYNLVVSCGACNRKKGCSDIVEFRPESGIKYLRALAAHLDRCMQNLDR